MSKNLVAVVRYEKPLESVRKAVELSHGLDHLNANARVFIKPNMISNTAKLKTLYFPFRWSNRASRVFFTTSMICQCAPTVRSLTV